MSPHLLRTLTGFRSTGTIIRSLNAAVSQTEQPANSLYLCTGKVRAAVTLSQIRVRLFPAGAVGPDLT